MEPKNIVRKFRIALNERELRIARLIASGKSRKQVCAEIAVSHTRLSQLLTVLYAKIGVDGRVGLAVWAAKNRLI
ncbi:MAG: LuxR C-terminal-related transcriptional regulator [Terriglobia bacterium]